MIDKLKLLKRSIIAADLSKQDVVISDLRKQINDIIKDCKKSEKVNHLYGLYFDKTYGDGLSAEEAARDLGLD